MFNWERVSALEPLTAALYKRLYLHLSNLYEEKYNKDSLKFEKDYEDLCGEWLGGLKPQGYRSLILQQLGSHLEAFKFDDRAKLYLDFLAYIEAFQPLAVVMENVPDVLNFGGMNVPEEVCDVLESRGYTCRYTLLNASHYGVPQMRERMFLIALAGELGQPVTLPAPTHRHTLPPGYEGTRAVALKMLADDLFNGSVTRFQRAPEGTSDLPAAVIRARVGLSSRLMPDALSIGVFEKRFLSADEIWSTFISDVQNRICGVLHGRISFTHSSFA